MLLALWLGCIHRIDITTVPAGAVLYRKEARLGEAPLPVRVPMFASPEIEARLPGYRSVTTRLRGVGTLSFVGDALTLRWGRAFGLRPKAAVEIRLMPEHGPVGTWGAGDVP